LLLEAGNTLKRAFFESFQNYSQQNISRLTLLSSFYLRQADTALGKTGSQLTERALQANLKMSEMFQIKGANLVFGSSRFLASRL